MSIIQMVRKYTYRNPDAGVYILLKYLSKNILFLVEY